MPELEIGSCVFQQRKGIGNIKSMGIEHDCVCDFYSGETELDSRGLITDLKGIFENTLLKVNRLIKKIEVENMHNKNEQDRFKSISSLNDEILYNVITLNDLAKKCNFTINPDAED